MVIELLKNILLQDVMSQLKLIYENIFKNPSVFNQNLAQIIVGKLFIISFYYSDFYVFIL